MGCAMQGSQSWDQNQEFEDIFSQFFGGGGNARGGFGGFSGGFGGFQGFRAKGPDIHAHIRRVYHLIFVASSHAVYKYTSAQGVSITCVDMRVPQKYRSGL